MIRIFGRKLQVILSSHGLRLIQASMPNHLRAMVFILTADVLVAILWIILHYIAPWLPAKGHIMVLEIISPQGK